MLAGLAGCGGACESPYSVLTAGQLIPSSTPPAPACSKTKATGISELKEMIKATTSHAEACLLRAELLALEAGA